MHRCPLSRAKLTPFVAEAMSVMCHEQSLGVWFNPVDSAEVDRQSLQCGGMDMERRLPKQRVDY